MSGIYLNSLKVISIIGTKMFKSKMLDSLMAASFMLIGSSVLPVNNNIIHKGTITESIAMAAESPIDKVLNEVKNKVAKDPRITLFDVKVTKNGNNIIASGRVLEENQKKELISALTKLGKVQDKIDVYPFAETGNLAYGIANAPVMQVRDHGKHASQLITQGLYGATMRIIGGNPQKDDWVKVSMDDDKYVGWVRRPDIWFVDKKEYDNWLNQNKIMITDSIVQLLKSPDINDKSELKVYMTTRLNLVGESGDFYKVKLPGGNKHLASQEVFVPKTSARVIGKKIEPLNITGKDIVLKAKTLISAPYLWGGSSPMMNDCSGFTQLIYKENGYVLPRDADQQQFFTQRVKSRNDLIPGDLVFFAENHGKEATHVGIYMGDGRFIHSSVGYGGVSITSFNPKDELYNQWYIDNYLTAGRVIKK